MDRQKWTPSTRGSQHILQGCMVREFQAPSTRKLCRNVNNNGSPRRNCAWRPFPALARENAWRPPHWIPFLQVCKCWEAKRFSTIVLGAQRWGTTVEIGAGCLGLPDPDIILTLVHTTSKPCYYVTSFNKNCIDNAECSKHRPSSNQNSLRNKICVSR